MPKISICVPVYSMKNGNSEKFLVEYFSNLMFQTFKDFDVIVSDQNPEGNLKSICDTFSYALDIKYYSNNSDIKNAANNVNFATSKATGDIIKLLYMDDFFVDVLSLQKILDAFDNNEGKWLICGFTHCNQDKTRFFDTRVPWFGNKYVNGDNTTGNPSTYAVRKECLLEMDENLLWLVDGEYFYRSYHYYGDPIIITDTLVAFREHQDSAFFDSKYRELDAKEREYCINKYKT
jgi:GT2 family glycosyltransferase